MGRRHAPSRSCRCRCQCFPGLRCRLGPRLGGEVALALDDVVDEAQLLVRVRVRVRGVQRCSWFGVAQGEGQG